MKCFHFLTPFVPCFPLLPFRVDIRAATGKKKFYRSFLKNVRNTDRNIPVLELLFNKVASLKTCNFIKKSNTDVLPWILGHFKEDLFWRTYLRTTASVDNFKTFHLKYFDFMSNTVCICIIFITVLSVVFVWYNLYDATSLTV